MQTRTWISGSMFAAMMLVLSGCARPAPSAPESSAPTATALATRDDSEGSLQHHSFRGFYPLELGNRWSFSGRYTIRSSSAGAPLELVYSTDRTANVELTCVETTAGHDYVVERSTTTEGSDIFLNWVRYRQDGAGLYEADLATNERPFCEEPGPAAAPHRSGATLEGMSRLPATDHPEVIAAAWQSFQERLEPLGLAPGQLAAARHRRGGVLPSEITRLRYPLHIGQRWIIRADPHFTSWVEGVQILRTPVGRLFAYRVRVNSDFFSPEDRVVLYFSRLGFLGVSAHLVSRDTDPNGIENLTIYDDVLKLEDLDLVRGRS